MPALTKADLIDHLAAKAGTTKRDANAVLAALTQHIHKTLKKGGAVKIAGVGKWSVTKRAARKGRNPQTGAVIKIKARKVPKFKASKGLGV